MMTFPAEGEFALVRHQINFGSCSSAAGRNPERSKARSEPTAIGRGKIVVEKKGGN